MRLLGLTNSRARRAADGGPDRTGDNGAGDGSGCSALLDRMTTGSQGQSRKREDGGGKGAGH